MTITGHEQPLYYGFSRVITCNVTGMEVATMQWVWVVAGFPVLFTSGSDVSELQLVLQLIPEVGSTWDGAEFMCVAIGTDKRRHEQSITIQVKGTHVRRLCVVAVRYCAGLPIDRFC